jgi:3-oxoacyl-[acyl-carrier protein] reductase
MGVAIVTGSSTGIGRQIAIALARDGHNIIVNSIRDANGGNSTVESIASFGGAALYVQSDVSSSRGAEEVMAAASRRFGAATILVNNAGATRGCEFGEWTEMHWHDMLDTNLVSTALMCQAFVTQVPSGVDASIVNIASVRGLFHSPRIGIAAYCAAKAGVINLTAALARTLAPHITINAISPGFVNTEYMNRVEDLRKSEWRHGMAIDRFIDTDEIARLVCFLTTQSALTGANIVLDGAWTITQG